MYSLKSLSNTLLLESYHRAINLQLNTDFIEGFKTEVESRGLLTDDSTDEANDLDF